MDVRKKRGSLLPVIASLGLASVLLTAPHVSAKEMADMGAPSTPINVSGSGSLSNQVTLNWDFGTYDLSTGLGFPDTFVIYRTVGSDMNFAAAQPLVVVSSNNRSYTDNTVMGGTQYNYKIAARLGGAESANSTVETVTTAQASFMVEASALGASKVKLMWNNVTPGVQKYAIYRAPVSGGYELVGSTTDLTFTDTGLMANTYYAYHVKPVTAMGEEYGGLAYVTTLGADRVAAPTMAPTLKGNPVIPSFNNLEWTAASDATSYALYRSTGSETSLLLATTTKLGFPDMSVRSGFQYTYFVKALNEFGESAPSNQVVIKTAAPSAPTSFVGKVTGRNEITLTWTSVVDAQTYTLYRSTDGNGFSSVGSISAPTLSYIDKDLAYDTTYYYYLKAKAGPADGSIGDEGEKSTTITLKTAGQFSSLEAPTVAGRALSKTSAEITWNAVPGATKYLVLRDYADQNFEGAGLFPGTGVMVTGTSYIDSQAFPLSRYTYTVSAIDSAGMGGLNGQASVDMTAPNLVPTKPADFTVTARYIELTPAIEFRSPRGLGSETPSVRRGNVFRFSYVYKNLTSKTQRVRVVRQVSAADGKIISTTGANSSVLAGRTVLYSPTIPTTRLSAGTYSVSIKIYDTVGSNYGKLLAEKSFTFSIR